MALKDISKLQTKEQKLNSSIALPRDRYTLLCQKEEFGLSKGSQQPMVTRVWEIVTQSVELPNGTQLIVAGAEITRYYALKSNGTPKSSPEKATAFLVDNFRDDTNAAKPDNGIDWSTFDDEHPPLVMKGHTCEAICGDEEQVERKAPKPGQKEGEIILGVDKKPIVKHRPKIVKFLGASETTVPQAY